MTKYRQQSSDEQDILDATKALAEAEVKGTMPWEAVMGTIYAMEWKDQIGDRESNLRDDLQAIVQKYTGDVTKWTADDVASEISEALAKLEANG